MGLLVWANRQFLIYLVPESELVVDRLATQSVFNMRIHYDDRQDLRSWYLTDADGPNESRIFPVSGFPRAKL